MRITSTAICGSDLHLLDGYVPTMQEGDVMGHEFMGEVVEVGPGVDGDKLRVGDRVVVPFPIACGACLACRAELYSCCENTNPNAGIAEKMFGHPVAGIFGYSHLTGGFAGGQAEYARVPFADVNPLRIESDLTDEQVLFLSDILPTGYMGAELCDIQDGDVVAVWGAGPVGQFAMDSARVLGAARVIAIDDVGYRLEMAASQGYQTINYSDTDVRSALLELTGGRGPDKCIDAVGMEATHGAAHVQLYDRVKQAVRSETDRPHALRQAIMSCRSGGIVSVIGVYGGFIDKFPAGAWMNRALTLRPASATSSGTCGRCWSGSSAGRSTRRGSSPTACRWRRHRTATTSSRTSGTVARRSFSRLDELCLLANDGCRQEDARVVEEPER